MLYFVKFTYLEEFLGLFVDYKFLKVKFLIHRDEYGENGFYYDRMFSKETN